MNTVLRSQQTQSLVKKSLRAISSTAKTESSTLPPTGLLTSWNGNKQTVVGSRKVSVDASSSYDSNRDEKFPMKLAHFIQRRNEHHRHHYHQQAPSLQEKWTKLASLTMDPSIADLAESIQTTSSKLPQTLTQVMSDSRPCMIASIDDPFTTVNVNQAWCQVYGYSKDKVLNQNMAKLLAAGNKTNSQPLEDCWMDHKQKHRQLPFPLLHITREMELRSRNPCEWELCPLVLMSQIGTLFVWLK